jgi:hypothetical protein
MRLQRVVTSNMRRSQQSKDNQRAGAEPVLAGAEAAAAGSARFAPAAPATSDAAVSGTAGVSGA